MVGVDTYALPRGPRDTRAWYRDANPMEQVDYALVDFVQEHAGRSVVDLGCGLGGYSKVLGERGFDVRAFDVVAEYVERARGLGVAAELYDGDRRSRRTRSSCSRCSSTSRSRPAYSRRPAAWRAAGCW